MTKNHSLLHIAILFALLFTGCSDDEPTPVKGNSLISGFRETYGFQAEKVGSESYEAKNLIIPVSGVSSYRDGVYDYTISANLYPRLPLPEGILYTAEKNPAWYNLHIKRYGDDSYSGKPLKDVYEEFRDRETDYMDTIRESIEAEADRCIHKEKPRVSREDR